MGDSDDTGPEFQSFIPFRIARLQAALNKQANHLLERHGDVTLTQWRIIVMLHEGRAVTLSDMAEMAGIDKGLLSRNLTALVDGGHVVVERDSADRRVNRLNLTSAGMTLHDQIAPIMVWRHERLTRDLEAEEVGAIQAIFDKLDVAAADEEYRPD